MGTTSSTTESGTTPTVVVELLPRRTMVLRAMLAGLATGGLLALLAYAEVVQTIAIGTSFDLSTTAVGWPFFWHFVFATLFGGVFGALIDTRPLWRYAVGFLGPAFGVVFGVAVWGVSSVLLEPLWLFAVGATATPGVPMVSEFALAGYLLYGGVLGVALNVAL